MKKFYFVSTGTVSVALLTVIATIRILQMHYESHAAYPLDLSRPQDIEAISVNVFGLFRHECGMAKAARSVVHCMDSVRGDLEIRTAPVDITAHVFPAMKLKQLPPSFRSTLPRPDFPIDLVAINGEYMSYIEDYLKKVESSNLNLVSGYSATSFKNHYRIGYWHWETSLLRLKGGYLGSLFNEIWVPSQYVADSIRSCPTFPNSTKIVILPYGLEDTPTYTDDASKLHARRQLFAVLQSSRQLWKTSSSLSRLHQWSREESTTVLFLVVFDFGSVADRKNFLGTYRAFEKAFPKYSDVDVGLIVKSVGHVTTHEYYVRIVALMNELQDDRVFFASDELSEDHLFVVKRAVDCYVSLHRSEGWGLNLLESIMLGVPVVATAYSGSEDFMKPLYSRLLPELRVAFRLQHIDQVHFDFYYPDMLWAEPDVNSSVAALQAVYSNLSFYRSQAKVIRQRALELMDSKTLGAAMAQRLDAITDCACEMLDSSSQYSLYFQAFSPACRRRIVRRNSYITAEKCADEVLGLRDMPAVPFAPPHPNVIRSERAVDYLFVGKSLLPGQILRAHTEDLTGTAPLWTFQAAAASSISKPTLPFVGLVVTLKGFKICQSEHFIIFFSNCEAMYEVSVDVRDATTQHWFVFSKQLVQLQLIHTPSGGLHRSPETAWNMMVSPSPLLCAFMVVRIDGSLAVYPGQSPYSTIDAKLAYEPCSRD